MEKLSKTEAAYLAGLLDGEGSIMMSYRNRRRHKKIITSIEPRIIVLISVKKRFINKVAKMVGSRRYTHSCPGRKVIRIKKGKIIEYRGKRCYSLNLYSRPAQLVFLKAVFPYLILKKEQGGLMLEYLTNRIPFTPITVREIEIAREIHRLNGGDKKRKMKWL